MGEWLDLQFADPQFHVGFLILIIAAMIFVLSKGADILVDEAIVLSTRWGVPKVVPKLTIVAPVGTFGTPQRVDRTIASSTRISAPLLSTKIIAAIISIRNPT
jgi:hypothetical protein